jgi:hypothetical protein
MILGAKVRDAQSRTEKAAIQCSPNDFPLNQTDVETYEKKLRLYPLGMLGMKEKQP